MEGEKQIPRSSSCSHGVQVPARQNAYWRIILIKESPPARSLLQTLPESLVSQNLVNEQAQQQQHHAPQMHAAIFPDSGLGEPAKKAFMESLNEAARKITELTSTFVQLEAARAQREEAACRSMNLAAQKMSQLVAAMAQLEAVKEERRALKRYVDLEGQLAASGDSDASVGSTSTRRRKTRRLTECLPETSMQGLNGHADCCGITTVGMIHNTLTMQDEEDDASSKSALSHG